MDKNKLWENFCENGRVSDYLLYRRCVNSTEKTELEKVDENNGIRPCDTGTEYR
jgi:hypothetical protein